MGIGTTSPGVKLDVSGIFRATGGESFFSYSGGGTSPITPLDLINPNGSISAGGGVGVEFGGGTGPNTLGYIYMNYEQNSTAYSAMTFQTSANYVITEKMRITSSGSVGIGSSSPTGLLTIQGTSGSTTNLLTVASSTNAALLTMAPSGILSVGTASTTAGQITLYNSSNGFTTALKSSSTQASNLTFTLPATTGSAGQALLTDSSGGLYFGTVASSGVSASGTAGMLQFYGSSSALNANANLLWDNTTDRLALGTTSTSSTFTLQGQAGSVPLLTVSSSTGSTLLTVLANGNVGIGTTTPAATLNVLGTGIIQSSTNTPTAFQVQNASGTPILLVDTTPTFGATTTNYIANPGFEVNTSGWAASGTGATIARVTTNKYMGLASLKIDSYGSGAGQGASTTVFTMSPAAGTYVLSFYARTDISSSSFSTLMAGFSTSTQFSACTLNSNTVSNLGWRRYNCSFTVSGPITQIFIGQSDANPNRTFYIDAIQLQLGSAPTPYAIGNIQLRGVITSPVSLQSLSNSVTAFQIQDQTGVSNLFIADTLNNAIDIGTSTGTSVLNIQGVAGSSNGLVSISSSTGASLMYLGANGRVGFGSSTPNATMVVEGATNLPTSDILRVASSSNAVFLNVTAAGNVGIGSVTPSSTLSLQGTSGTNPLYIASSTGAGLMVIQQNGNVGIGTTTVNSRLVVQGTGITNATAAETTYNASGTLLTTILNNGNLGIGSATPSSTFSLQGTSGTNPLYIASSTGTGLMVIQQNGNVGIGSSSPIATLSLTGTSGTNPLVIASSTGTQLLTILQNGNVGIGSATPSSTFSLQGTSGTNPLYIASSTGTALMVIQQNGNVGIGTSTGLGALTISSSTTTMPTLYVKGVPSQTADFFDIYDAANNPVLAVSAYDAVDILTADLGARLNIYTSGTQKIGEVIKGSYGQQYDLMQAQNSSSTVLFNITAYGSVGIGTTSPTGVLSVQSNSTTIPTLYIQATSSQSSAVLNIASSSGTSYLTVLANGNVGIGTSGPVSLLTLQGSTTASGANAVAGIFASTTLANTTAGGYEFGNRLVSTVSGSASGTMDGMLIRMIDSTSLVNVVRGLEVQAYSGTNNAGVNTGIIAFGHTFGIQGFTDGLAASAAQPAGVYAELDHPTSGNALRAYSNTSTTATLVEVFQEGSTFSGNGLVMDLASTTGSFTGNFMKLINAGVLKMSVNSSGKVTAAGGFNGQCLSSGYFNNASTTGSCNMDVAEIYPSLEPVAAGDVLVIDNTSSSTPQVKQASKPYDANLIGVVSTAPGLILGTGQGEVLLGGDSTIYNTTVIASTSPAVALTGRVPVNVTNENGDIAPGDFLTSSARLPGYAMKATRSGYVLGQALESFQSASSATATSTIMIFVKPAYQVINNTFVLGEDDGQLASATSTFTVLSSASSTATTMLVNQMGSGGLLQLQQGGADRLLVANDGSINILASTTIATSTILTVSNGSAAQFSITAAGHITVGQDTAGTATITAGDNQTAVTFAVPYDTVPKIAVTVQGLPDFFYGVATKTPAGFTIQTSQPLAADTSFDWIALAQPSTSTSQSSLNSQIVVASQPSGQGQIISGSSPSGGSSTSTAASSGTAASASTTPDTSGTAGQQVAGTSTSASTLNQSPPDSSGSGQASPTDTTNTTDTSAPTTNQPASAPADTTAPPASPLSDTVSSPALTNSAPAPADTTAAN